MYATSFTSAYQHGRLLRKVRRAADTMSWLRSESASLQEEVIQLRAELKHKNKIIDALVEQNRELRKVRDDEGFES